MRYVNKDLDISLELPKGWVVMDDRDMLQKQFNMTEEELEPKAFAIFKMGEGTQVLGYISATVDIAIYETEKAYVFGLVTNKKQILESGSKIESEASGKTTAGDRTDKLVVSTPDGKLVQHFVYINTILMCFSSALGANDAELEAIVKSLQVVETPGFFQE